MKKIYAIVFLCYALVVSAQNYRIGDVYTAPDGSKGVVYYIHPDGSGGWVVALNDASTGCPWGDATDVPELANQNSSTYQNLLNDTAGYINTQILRNYQNNNTTYAAGMVDFAHGWVLPSLAQLSMLYGQLPFITSAIVSAGGTALAYGIYWCSSEIDASKAWAVDFGGVIDGASASGEFVPYSGCFLSTCFKTGSFRVRAVRSFSYPATVVYDTFLTYQWNTGSMQPYINVSPNQTTNYTVTATTEFGCSNTAEQTIIVGTGAAQTIYDTICKGAGYEANGFTLTEAETGTAGTLTRTRTLGTEGCSSNLTLQLKVNEPVASTSSATAHGSYNWNGVTYYESGDYTQTFTAVNGCDSVVTLHLTLTDPPGVTIVATDDTICEGNEVILQAIVPGGAPVYYVPTVAVGDILCTDNSVVKPTDWPVPGKTAMGVVCYVDSTGEHGWAVHKFDQATSLRWNPNGQNADIPDLTNYSDGLGAITDFDGYNNTLKIRAAGNSTQYPAAYAVDIDNDWYLPAVGQLRIIYSEFVILNASLQIIGGSQFPMEMNYYYLSSSEHSEVYAWYVNYFGYVYPSLKTNTGRVRSVRTF